MKKIITSVLLTSFSLAFGQWNPNPAINNTVCIQPYDQINVKMIPDFKGGAILVWEDYRNSPTRTSADIYAQRINANGNPVWQANGIPVCTDTAHQSSPTLVTDSFGGAIIVWQDHRNPKRNLYTQRIDSSGTTRWAINGVGVTLRNYDQKNPKLLTDGSHGAIVIWQDSVGGSYDIYEQHLDASGTALWPNGIGICISPQDQINPKAQITSAGDIYVTWQDKRNGTDYDIYAQRLNIAGTAQWTANGIAVCTVAGTQSNPRIIVDGGGGTIISWQDKRNGVDYDVFLQRLNASGIAQWTANGINICNAGGSQTSIDITAQNITNGAIIAWKDPRNGTNNVDIYAQYVNLSGTVLWTGNGIPVANAPANQISPNIMSDGTGGAIVSYQDSSGGSWDIKSQRINPSGNLLWTSSTIGIGIGTAARDQTNQTNMLISGGSSIYAFQDTRSGNNDIYIYRVDQNGQVTGIPQVTGNHQKTVVFPNPSGGKITFCINDPAPGWILRISDINGKSLLEKEITGNRLEVTEALEAGMYFYSVFSATTCWQGKFTIVK